MTFTPIRHCLLLSLQAAPGLTVRELARLVHRAPTTTYWHLQALVEAGLAESVAPYPLQAGFRLRPGVVVGERGFVGCLVPLDLAPWGRDVEVAACG